MGRRDESSWTTIESDPGVFTELIENIGVQGVQVEEIWSLDKESLMNLSPVWGLVFLFKYVKDAAKRNEVPQPQDDVFFAQQVIPNACATQAILNILLNLPASSQGVTLGPELTAFRDFTADLPPDMKGLAISNSDLIRTVHNSLARPESLLPDEDQKQQQEGDAFHFVAYLPVHGSLYELDGLQPAPIRLATDLNTEGAWLEAVIPHISARMERYAAGEVRFNLMALVADRRTTLEQQIAQCRSQRDGVAEDDKSTQHVLDEELNRLQHELAQEHARRQTWKEENVRRRQNYIPLMFNLLKALADADQLKQFIELAKQPKKPKKEAAAADSMQE